MLNKPLLAAASLALISHAALAANAAVFNQEIGVATYQSVNTQVGAKTRLRDAGINAYSNGRMLESNGQGLSIDGLSRALFIFDAPDRLVAAELTLPKGPLGENIDPTLAMLKRKYRQVRLQRPFVGNVEARYEQGVSLVELNAPHMSFELTVTYMTRPFEQQYRAAVQADATSKNRHREASF